MGRKKTWQDDELVSIIWDWRVANGACTLEDLTRATGLAMSSVHRRVRAMIEAGRLTRSETAGSIRATSERLMEQLPDGRLIERGPQRRSKSA